jgi:hypothetical protein
LVTIEARRNDAIAAGAVIPGLGTVKTVPESVDNITQAVVGAVLAAVTSQPYTIAFPFIDGSRPTLSGAQMMAIGKIVGERKNACHSHAATLAAAVGIAADFAALAAIDINAGWPQ